MASSSPLLSGTIEADDDTPAVVRPKGSIGTTRAKPEPVVLVPGTQANGSARAVEEGGIVSRYPPNRAFFPGAVADLPFSVVWVCELVIS